MIRFLYFVPGPAAATRTQLPAGPYHDVLAGGEVEIRPTNGGPDGQPGNVFALTGGETIGFFPARQTWWAFPGFWLGAWTEDGQPKYPAPAELRRPNTPAGEKVTLADGREWEWPLLGPAWRQLPETIRPTASGDYELVLPDAWRDLCRESESWFAKFEAAATGETYRILDFFQFAARCLGRLYYIGEAEIGQLALIERDENQHVEIAAAIFGAKRLVALKKKADDGRGGSAAPSGD